MGRGGHCPAAAPIAAGAAVIGRGGARAQAILFASLWAAQWFQYWPAAVGKEGVDALLQMGVRDGSGDVNGRVSGEVVDALVDED